MKISFLTETMVETMKKSKQDLTKIASSDKRWKADDYLKLVLK